MAGLADLEARIEKLEQATEEIRDATREAHAATKDLRQVKREVEELLDRIPVRMREEFDARAEAVVREGLEHYSETIKSAQNAAVDRVGKTFTELANLHLYGNAQGRGPSVFEEMAQRARGVRP